MQSPLSWPRPSWVPSSWAAEGGGCWGGPQAWKGGASRRGRGPGPVGVPTSLQGLQHQQLLQHLRLAGLTDLTGQEHLVHDRVHLSEVGRGESLV